MADANELQYAAPDPQRDAADRLSRLHGALELKAALLALLLPADSRRAARAFEIETADARQAPGVHAHSLNLAPAARLPWFELLLTRMALQPLPLRQELLQATRRVIGARGRTRPIDLLHWLAMRRGLGERPGATGRGSSSGDVSEWLEADLLAIASYSAYLSRMVPVERGPGDDAQAGTDWYVAVMEPWQGGVSLPACEPPNGEGVVHALAILQTLSMMQRPVLARGWVSAAHKHRRQGRLTDSAADALRLSCSLLDTPMPPELEHHYGRVEGLPK
jgi:hypothetical protein